MSLESELKSINLTIDIATYYNLFLGLLISISTSSLFFQFLAGLPVISGLFGMFGFLGVVIAIVFMFVGIYIPRYVVGLFCDAWRGKVPIGARYGPMAPARAKALLIVAGIFTIWAILGSLLLWYAAKRVESLAPLLVERSAASGVRLR